MISGASGGDGPIPTDGEGRAVTSNVGQTGQPGARRVAEENRAIADALEETGDQAAEGGRVAAQGALHLGHLAGEKGSPQFALGDLADAAAGHWWVLTGCRKGTVPAALFSESLALLVGDGKPVVASQSADPRSDRKVAIEVIASIIK